MIGGDSEQFSNFQDQFGSGHVFAGFEVAAVAVLILYKYIVILSSITTLKEGDSVNLLNLDPQPQPQLEQKYQMACQSVQVLPSVVQAFSFCAVVI